MKSKKWLIIGITAVLFILLEAAATILFVVPSIYKNKMIDALKAGDGTAAASYYDKVKFLVEGDRDAVVKGFIISETNDYLRGNGTYEDVIKKVRASESIGAFKGKNLEAVEDISLTQCINVLEDSHSSFYEEDDKILDAVSKFSKVYNVTDVAGVSLLDGYVESDKAAYQKFMDERLDGYLKGKFSKFKAGEMDFDEIYAYVSIARTAFNETEYCDELGVELEYIKLYEDQLKRIKQYMEDGEYATAYQMAKSMLDVPADQSVFPEYKADYTKAKDEAYKKAKEDGLAKALELAKAGDEDGANAIMDELREMCGNDVDFSEIEKYLTPKWAKAYAAFMADWDKNLNTQCTTSPYVKTSSSKHPDQSINSTEFLQYDKFKPEKLFIADIDNNGTPEMVLMSSLTCYIETYSDDRVKLVTLVVPLTGLGENGVVIQNGENTYGTIKISGDSAEFTHFVYNDDILYYRNGYGEDFMVDKSDYQEEYDIIKSMDVYPLPGTYAVADYQKAIDDFRSHQSN